MQTQRLTKEQFNEAVNRSTLRGKEIFFLEKVSGKKDCLLDEGFLEWTGEDGKKCFSKALNAEEMQDETKVNSMFESVPNFWEACFVIRIGQHDYLKVKLKDLAEI